eukprot:gene1561-8422_t
MAIDAIIANMSNKLTESGKRAKGIDLNAEHHFSNRGVGDAFGSGCGVGCGVAGAGCAARMTVLPFGIMMVRLQRISS